MLLLCLDEQPLHRKATLQSLAQLYGRSGRHDQAIARLRELFALMEDPELKAACALAMGGNAESMGDFAAAVIYYREALTFEPSQPDSWYFIHNNLGYSLNQLGQFMEGESLCRKAITILPGRPNAHKNLGLALAGQQRWREAATCYVEATRVRPSDPRSCVLLEELLRDHAELQAEFRESARACRCQVDAARSGRN